MKKIEVVVTVTTRCMPLPHHRGFTTLATILVNGVLVASGNIEGKRGDADVLPEFAKHSNKWKIVNKEYLALAQSVGKIPSAVPKVTPPKKPDASIQKVSLTHASKLSIKSGDGLKQVGQLFAAARQFLLNNGLTTSELDASWDKVVQVVEAFPVHTDGINAIHRPMFFILAGGEWWPVHAGELNEKYAFGPCLNYRIDYLDGSSESGPAMLGKWANSTSDNQPSLPDEVGYWDNYKAQEPFDLDKYSFSEWFYNHQRKNPCKATQAI